MIDTFEIEKVHGQEGSRLAAESHTAAIDRIEAISQAEGIKCDFVRVGGYLFLRRTLGGSAGTRTCSRSPGWPDGRRLGATVADCVVRYETLSPVSASGTVSPDQIPCGCRRRRPEQGRQDIHEHACHADRGRDEAVRVVTDGGVVKTRAIVVATNTPINDLVAIHTKQAPYLTYVIVPASHAARSIGRCTGTHWDAYHYIRVQPTKQGDVLLIGGEDHKAGQAADPANHWNLLESWARERFPAMESVEYQWSGMVMETIDGLAFIGRNPMDHDNVFIVTGDSGMGLTHGTIAGILLNDLIAGRDNPWSAIYDPTRKPIRGMALKEFISENANVAKELTRDWLSGGDVSSVAEIARGEGAIVRRGISKIAVYRDGRGAVHERSAVCPHLGCVVHWNGAEKTWDCPCHGSRFDPKGSVIAGPANSPLAET